MKKTLFAKSIVLVILLLPLPLASKDTLIYLEEGVPNVLELLFAPPSDGTPEQIAELATTRRVSLARTKSEIDMAQATIKLDFFTYSPVIGPWFKEESFPVTAAFFRRVEIDTRRVTNKGKDFWKRKRPYDADTSIPVIQKEKSLSYPSGHATRGIVYATVLSEIFPEKKRN